MHRLLSFSVFRSLDDPIRFYFLGIHCNARYHYLFGYYSSRIGPSSFASFGQIKHCNLGPPMISGCGVSYHQILIDLQGIVTIVSCTPRGYQPCRSHTHLGKPLKEPVRAPLICNKSINTLLTLENGRHGGKFDH